MAISINYTTNIISIPQADLLLISGTLHELDTDQFRKDLNNIADSEEGIVFVDTHKHTQETTIVGITYARFVEILSPYSIQFTPDAQYSVRLTGSNNNIFDVENSILVQNQVQIIANNSAGLISGNTAINRIEQFLRNKVVTDPATGVMTVFDDVGDILFTANIFEDAAGLIPYKGNAINRKERFT